MKEVLINRRDGKGSFWVTIPDEDWPPLNKGTWTDDEALILERLYPDYPVKQVARALSRDVSSVMSRAFYVGVRRKTPKDPMPQPDTLGRVA